VGIPTENLISPDLVRRLCWDWEDTANPADAVEGFLRAGHAREWQRELVVSALAAAVQSPADAEAETD
jgi:ribonuclease D